MPLPEEGLSFVRLSAKEKVYETVKNWIIEGQFQPGERISDIEIASYMKVSRTPVREAFQMLEAQKLIKSYPGRATVVTDLELDNIDKWYLPMGKLQQMAAELASDHAGKMLVRRLRRLNEEFKDCTGDQEHPLSSFKADKAFHAAILEAADNEYVTDFCNVLWVHIQRFEYRYFQDVVLEPSVEEHARMIDLLEQKDGKAAGELMKAHWERSAALAREANIAAE